eukprot:981377-Pyramimonas_sp.AAC.1
MACPITISSVCSSAPHMRKLSASRTLAMIESPNLTTAKRVHLALNRSVGHLVPTCAVCFRWSPCCSVYYAKFPPLASHYVRQIPLKYLLVLGKAVRCPVHVVRTR